MKEPHKLSIGLEAGYDPTWLAGLQYVRNLTYTLTSLPANERPLIRLLPVDSRTVDRVADLARYENVDVASSRVSAPLMELGLRSRRFVRKVVQPLIGRVIHPAFRRLDVTYPGWGTPLPGVPQMHWVPDLQHVYLPHLFETSELELRDRQLNRLSELDTTLIFSSHAALADFHQVFTTPRARTRVWQFCSPLTEQELAGADPHDKYSLPSRYIYVANQFWAHKDHLTLFRALTLLPDGEVPTVVCTGPLTDRRNPGYIEQIRRFLRDEGLEGNVRLLGVVPRADQIAILRHATLVVQPSQFEGWSTVVEDAKAVGRPLLLSDFRVHKEQAPNHTFFKMGSAESLAAALREYLPHLPDGPDEVAEERARIWLEARRQELARAFLVIAEEAVAFGRGASR